jgi:hypothetical protein
MQAGDTTCVSRHCVCLLNAPHAAVSGSACFAFVHGNVQERRQQTEDASKQLIEIIMKCVMMNTAIKSSYKVLQKHAVVI